MGALVSVKTAAPRVVFIIRDIRADDATTKSDWLK